MKFPTSVSAVLLSSSLLSSASAHNARHARYLARQAAASSTSIPLPTDVSVPPLADITQNNPTEPTAPLDTVYSAGITPTLTGAPGLPTASVIMTVGYPQQDQVPDVNSPQVQQWLTELDGYNIPDIRPTADGSCVGDPAMASNASASGNCWWTCGQCSRPEDITVCPDKMTWGLSYDDGPSPYTSKILNYLNEEDLKATFFVVGSRVPGRADILQAEYMSGHMISVHTWSHPPLTSLTNAQIVAELGWTRQIIKDAIGVTPNTMRPPYGDIDDRVRAVSLAMGLRPIIWTSYGDQNFDTDDWRIYGGTATGNSSLATFEQILNTEAPALDTGFIVLEHDLYQQTVDLAIGWVLPMALTHEPPFKLMSISDCYHLPASEAYVETASTSPFRGTDGGLVTAANNTQATATTSSMVSTTSSSSSSGSGSGSSSGGSATGAGGGTSKSASASASAASASGTQQHSGAAALSDLTWLGRLGMAVGVVLAGAALL